MSRRAFLPVSVETDGLSDDTNGSYVKGRVVLTTAEYGKAGQVWSISEGCLVSPEELEAEFREKIAQELESYIFGHNGYCAVGEVGLCTCETTKKSNVARTLAHFVRSSQS